MAGWGKRWGVARKLRVQYPGVMNRGDLGPANLCQKFGPTPSTSPSWTDPFSLLDPFSLAHRHRWRAQSAPDSFRFRQAECPATLEFHHSEGEVLILQVWPDEKRI